jgi:hypothetical protein
MKELVSVLLTMALVIAGSALAVEHFHDRETFIPPPDAVAEGFVREVLMKRWDRARPYLAKPDSMSNADLEALEKSWESRAGDPWIIEAEMITRTDDEALATVRMQSEKGSEAVSFTLVFDREWKIVTELSARSS